jgi:hypothetical protein
MNMSKNRLIVIALLALPVVGLPFYQSLRGAAPDTVQESKTGSTELGAKLIGTWKLEEASTPGSPSGIGSRLRLFTGTHWCVIQPRPNSGVIVFQHGGRYVLEGNVIKETVDFAGESTRSLIGQTGSFTLQLEGDTYKQVDPKGVFNETWRRVK